MRWLAVILMLASCGDGGGGDEGPGGGGGGDLVDDLSVRTIATLAPDMRALAIAPLDAARLAVARIDNTGDAFCPDCVGLDPEDCPLACKRSLISLAVLDTATGAFDGSRAIATVFPDSYDHDVDQLELVALGDDRLGVAWLDCDNASCATLASKLSCTARYTTLDLTTGAVGATQTLYDGWFGDLHLAFEPTTRQLLAVIGKDLVMGAGVFRAIYDETGTTVLSPWSSLGSTNARSPALLASRGELLVVADDWSPAAAALATPCKASCACLGPGPIDLGAGGLYAFHVGAGADRIDQIAAGTDSTGIYHRREKIAMIDAGGRTMIAATQSIDRSAEIFTTDGVGWAQQLSTKAPIPMWVGALGTTDHFAWLGAQPEPAERATVQRLVAGISADDMEQRATFTEPLERNVFAAVPLPTPAGVTTSYLLQGVFSPPPATQWDRFEVLAIDAAW